MTKNVLSPKIFIYVFNIGLVFLIIDIVKDFTNLWLNSELLASIPFSAIGLIICLTGIPFLLIQWLTLPLGTHQRRITLYQGFGNLFALVMLIGGWIWREGFVLNSTQHFNEYASMTFSSGSLLAAVISGWLGGQIAAYISKKNIRIEVWQTPKIKSLPLTKANPSEPLRTATALIKSVSGTPATQN